MIITSQNAGSNDKKKALIELARNPNSNIWVLSAEDHPDEYKDTVDLCPFYENWEPLLYKIRCVLRYLLRQYMQSSKKT